MGQVMGRILAILSWIVVLVAGPVPAQEVFEVPIELELPVAPLVFELDNASLEVVLEEGALPVLRALGGLESTRGAAIALTDSGTTITVRRAESQGEPAAVIPGGPHGKSHGGATGGSHGSATGSAQQLRFELVFPPGHRLEVSGSELDVTIEAPPVAQSDEEDDDEEDEDEGEDDDEGDDEDELETQPVMAADGIRLSLALTDSSATLSGVVGASVNATQSYVHASNTRGKLTLALERATVESEGHQGAIDLFGRDSEVSLNDALGQVKPALTGGSLIVNGGAGPINGPFDSALLSVSGRRGQITVTGTGATIVASDLSGARIDLKGARHEVSIDDLQGSVLADLNDGNLSVSQMRGQATITARAGAEISFDGVVGTSKLTLKDCSASLVDVTGQVTAELQSAHLELDGVRRLDLVARRSEIVASRLESLTRAEITNSQLDFDLQELKHNPTLTLKGSSDARIRLQAPCSVKMGMLSTDANVNGCDVQAKGVPVRRKRYERRGLSGQRRVTLNVKMAQGSTLEVDGVQ